MLSLFSIHDNDFYSVAAFLNGLQKVAAFTAKNPEIPGRGLVRHLHPEDIAGGQPQ